MKYVIPNKITKEEAEKIFKNRSSLEIAQALIQASLSIDDYDWLISKCALFEKDADCGLKKAIVLSLCSIVRRFKKMDQALVDKIVDEYREYDELAGVLSDLLDDIDIYIK